MSLTKDMSINPFTPLILNSEFLTFEGSFLYFSNKINNSDGPKKFIFFKLFFKGQNNRNKGKKIDFI